MRITIFFSYLTFYATTTDIHVFILHYISLLLSCHVFFSVDKFFTHSASNIILNLPDLDVYIVIVVFFCVFFRACTVILSSINFYAEKLVFSRLLSTFFVPLLIAN